ncbi:MAG: hypothetical protein ACRDT2_21180, partial [Natronosporangium sp.]
VLGWAGRPGAVPPPAGLLARLATRDPFGPDGSDGPDGTGGPDHRPIVLALAEPPPAPAPGPGPTPAPTPAG